jgi:hypothetical protein
MHLSINIIKMHEMKQQKLNGLVKQLKHRKLGTKNLPSVMQKWKMKSILTIIYQIMEVLFADTLKYIAFYLSEIVRYQQSEQCIVVGNDTC